jgi:glycosyltransferase involved in cell wall biosynthesis
MLLTEGSAEEIAGHVEAILASRALADRLSAHARAFARRHYRWDRQAQKLAHFLNRVI